MGPSVTRRTAAALHRLDHALGRLASTRRVLVEMRTPVYYAVLHPIFDALREMPDVDVSFTSEYPDRIRPLVGSTALRTHQEIEWTRFDVYMNADPWAAARLRRCARRVNFFHGVAGKYDLDRPEGLPMGFQYYDRVAFINRDRMQRYLDAGIVTPRQARLVGYPKLDRLASGRIDGAAIRDSLKLDPGRATAFYGPTYSPASSLHLDGIRIVTTLADHGFNVIVKLHDRSLDADPRYSGGIDWRQRLRAIERPGHIRYVEGPDATPYLAAADVMVTDHSSVGFEYLVLDRPLIVFEAPDLPAAARINPEKIALLRRASTVVRTPQELAVAAWRAIDAPGHLSAERRQVAQEIFYDAGSATKRALALVQELIAQVADAPSMQPSADAQALGGGLW